MLAIVIEGVKIDHFGVVLEDECLGSRVGHGKEDFVGMLDLRDGLEGELTDALDAGAHDDQTSRTETNGGDSPRSGIYKSGHRT
jgi:hypothetical protein